MRLFSRDVLKNESDAHSWHFGDSVLFLAEKGIIKMMRKMFKIISPLDFTPVTKQKMIGDHMTTMYEYFLASVETWTICKLSFSKSKPSYNYKLTFLPQYFDTKKLFLPDLKDI